MLTITAIAEQKIKELMVEEKDIVGLRVYVKGGGCILIVTYWPKRLRSHV